MNTPLQFGNPPGRPGPRSRPLAATGGLWKLLAVVGLMLTSLGASAQASGYTFAQSSGTYTALTTPVLISTANSTGDDTNYPAVTIPFTFVYNGSNFTTLSANDNGWAKFGAAGSGGNYIALSTIANAIAVLNQDLQGGGTGSDISYQTLGATPNRKFVVQWKNYTKFGNTGTGLGDAFNFQLVLNETTNTIQLVYGAVTVNANATTVQAGLSGSANTDFNTRTGSTFAATTAGTANTSAVVLSNAAGVAPASGLTFTYTPPLCPGSAPTASAIAQTTATISFATVAGDTYTVSTSPGLTGYPSTVSASPVNLSGLSPNGTVYTVSVVRNCAAAGAGSSAALSTSFTTLFPNQTPTYATLPASESFEGTWITNTATRDVPSLNWRNFTATTGNTSWRREDDGAAAAWTTVNGVGYPFAGAKGSAHSARCHTSATTTGSSFYYYVNLSPAGTKVLRFDVFNPNRTVTVALSTDGGTNFSAVTGGAFLATGITTPSFVSRSVSLGTSTSATCIVRFTTSTTTTTSADIGLDNVSVSVDNAGPALATTPVTSITATGATLNWTAGTGPYRVSYGPTGYAFGSSGGTVVTGITATTLALTGLTASTGYDYYVQQTVSGALTAPTAGNFMTSFGCTTPTYATMPVFESFETLWTSNCALRDVPGANWKNGTVTGNPSWRRQDDGYTAAWTSPTTGGFVVPASQGSQTARFHSSATSSTGSLDVYVNLSTSAYQVLNFDYINTSSTDNLKIQLSINGGTSFTDVPGATFGTSAAFSTKAVNLPVGGTATSIIRFLGQGASDFASDISIDNVVVVPSTCPPPALGATTAIAYNQATVNFTSNGGGTFFVSYGPTGFAPGSGTNEIVTSALPAGTTSYTITGLTGSTGYDFYVSQDCSNTSNGGGIANYSTKGSFTTLVACPTPTTSATTVISNNQATVNFSSTSGGGSYLISYYVTSAGAGTALTTTALAGSTSKVLTGLTANTGYTFTVQQNCAGSSTGTGTSAVSTAGTFTTTVDCPTPTTSPTTSIFTTSATVNYSTVAGGGSYIISYYVTSAGVGTAVTLSPRPAAGSTSAVLTGLNPSTNYTFTVQQDCTGSSTGTGIGAASTAATFTTATPPTIAYATSVTALTISNAYTSIAITGTSVPFSGAGTDDQTSNAVTLPFAFSYAGSAVTGFKVCTNGWMTVNTAETSSSFSNALGSTPVSVLAPFWDDLTTQPNNSSTATLNASMKYLVTGSSPNRVLTVEWINMTRFGNPDPKLNFQVKLYETTNNIEYVYGEMSGFRGTSNVVYSYSLGLGISSGSYLAQQVANNNYFLTASSDNLTAIPNCNSQVAFTPGSFSTGPAPTIVAPTNDNPSGALTLGVSTTPPTSFCSTFNSLNATATSSAAVNSTTAAQATCSATTPGNADDDVWFKFTTASVQNVSIKLYGAGGYDAVLQVFSGTPGNLTALDCQNVGSNSSVTQGATETYTGANVPAGTYYVRVYEASAGSGSNGTFALNVFLTPPPPVNDNCSTATNLTLPATAGTCTNTAGTTVGATASSGGIATCSASTPGNPDDDVWFKFTTDAAGIYSVTAQGTAGSGFDAVLQAFSGTCTGLSALDCANATTQNGSETLTLNGLSASTTYYLRVYDAPTGSSGTFDICVQKFCSPPTAVTVGSVTTNSASVTFTDAPGVTNYTITTTPATSPYTVSSGATPTTLTGLADGTSYTVNVVNNCTNLGGGTSTAATATFTTVTPPPAFTTSRSTGISYNSIASSGQSFPFNSRATSTTGTDDNTSAAVVFPFPFTYLGTTVAGFKLCTNGWMTLDSTQTTTNLSNAVGTTSPLATLAPFWEDLVTQGNPATATSLAASFKYETTGSSPSRVLTVEWINLEKFNYAGPNLNFQVKLYETSNRIEFLYGNMTGFDGSAGTTFSAALTYSVGLNGLTAGAITAGKYLALQAANTNDFQNTNAASSNTGANALSVTPACYSRYTFAPAASLSTGPVSGVVVPSNDSPATPIVLTLAAAQPTADNGGFCATYSSANATGSDSPVGTIPTCSATTPGNADDDVFFTFVVPNTTPTSNITIYLPGAFGYDPVLQLLSGTPGSFASVACINATGSGLTETYNGILNAGTYYIRVYDAAALSGANGAFSLAVYPTPVVPGNDECAAAFTIPSTAITCTLVTGTTVAATASATATPSIPVCNATTAGTPDDDVWYTFTTPSTVVNDYTITLQSGTGFNGVLQLLTGSCGSLTATSCTNNTSTGGTETIVAPGLPANTKYYVRVYHAGTGSGSGSFQLCVYRTCVAPGTVAATSTGVGTANVTFTNGGSNNFTVTATPTSGPGTATVNGNGTTGVSPGVGLTGLVSGTTYNIVVQGDCGSSATSTAISFTSPFPVPANDNPTGAVALTLNTSCIATNSTTGGATATTPSGYTNPGCGTATSPKDVWFTVATTANGAGSTSLSISVVGTPAGQVRAFSSTTGAAGPFTQVGCVSGGAANTQAPALTLTGLTSSTTYYVSVSGYTNTDTQGSFTICATLPPNCNAATGVASSNVSYTTASITFTPSVSGASDYSVTYYPTATPAATTTQNSITSSPVSLTGLLSNTAYTLVFTTNCTSGGSALTSTVTFKTLAFPPANDDCTAAIALTPAASCTTTAGTVLGATQSLAAITCNSNTSTASPVADVWYKFTATSTIHTISVVGNFNGVLEARTGTCASSTNYSCSDASTGNNETLTIATTVGTTYLIRYYPFTANPAIPTFSICVTQPVDLVINASNSPFNLSGTFNNITIQNGGVVNLTGALTVAGTLDILSGGRLNTTAVNFVLGAGNFNLQAGGTLGIQQADGIAASGATGAIRNTGAVRAFSNDANYIYNGTTAQNTGSGLPSRVRNLTVSNSANVTLSQAVSIAEVATMANGVLNTNGLAFTLLSRIGVGTALIVDRNTSTTAVNGMATMQRAVDILTSDNIGYHHYSSPVVSTPIEDLQTPGFDFVLNAAYNTAASAGTVRPFPTVFGYNDTRTTSTTVGVDQNAFNKGFFSPVAGSAMPVGRGFTASVPNALLIDFNGTFNNGDITLAGLTRASTNSTTGYHLLGNPYPAPIDWATMQSSQFTGGIQEAVYQYHATSRYDGFYTTISPTGIVLVPSGVTNRPDLVGNTLLDAGSGFFAWVPNTVAVGTPTSITLKNANRRTIFAGQPNFGRSTVRPQLKLQVRGAGLQDELFVYAEAAASAGYDAAFDAAKLTNTNGLNLAALVAGKPLAIDALPGFATTTVVPLTLGAPAAGTYTFEVAQLANLGTTRAYLRDAVTGTETLLAPGTQVPVTLTNVATATTRFSLVFRPSGALATAASLTAGQVSLYPNPAHSQFTVLLPPVAGAKEVKATLLNALGQTISTRTIALTAAGATAEFNTSNLAQGVYMLRLTAGNETLTQRVVVE